MNTLIVVIEFPFILSSFMISSNYFQSQVYVLRYLF